MFVVIVYALLNMTLFVGVEDLISLQSFSTLQLLSYWTPQPYALPLIIHWFVESYDSICLPSFMSFSAVVSEICLLNGKEKKKNLEIYSFQFNSSPSHIKYCVVLQFKPELAFGHMFTLTKLELRKPQTESIISDFLIYTTNGKPWPSLYTQHYRTM